MTSSPKPAVFNQRSTGVLPGEQGVLQDLRTFQDSADAWTQLLTGRQASNVHLGAAAQQAALPTDTPLRVGRVVLAMPYIHCYKVQISGRQGSCIATAVSRNSHMPIGVKAGDVIPPNSAVLLWHPTASSVAFIIAVLPEPTVNDMFNLADMIQQGGNSGPKRVEAYRTIPKAAAMSHGWVSQCSGRPMDGTIGEYVRMSETGIGLLIDSFQTYLRANETCGLWLNSFDSYTKLMGLSLVLQSYCEHVFQQYDEGELFSLKGYATFPWEATGLYNRGEAFSKTNDPKQVQLDRQFPFATEDLKDFSLTPIYRLADYTGYLGQGFNRTLMRPAKQNGPRLRTDAEADKDIGLFNEMLTLDGAYGLRSAKQIMFVKYPLIPTPRRKRTVEDAGGDDLTKDNDYKFSGVYGNGDEHKVREWDSDAAEEAPTMLQSAGILDLIVRHFNWKSPHAFHYHKKDYVLPEEGDTESPLNEVQFCRGVMTEAYVDVKPQKLTIDERYREVKYYNTASCFTLNEDGSIVIADGYGSQITMGGGQIRLEAGGDVMLMSGSRVVTLSNEAVIRTKGSIDLSSSDADVRVKAERNVQVLGGNAGVGTILLECKGQGTTQRYRQKIGEETEGSGIVLLSRGGSVNMMTKTAYFRTGVDVDNAESDGDFVIDCANGRSRFVSYALGHSLFNSEGLGIWHSPSGQDAVEIDKSNYLGPSFSKIQGPTVMSKDVCIIEKGNLGVDDSIYAKGRIMALKEMACFRAAVGDTSADSVKESLSAFIEKYQAFADTVTAAGSPIFEQYYPGTYWTAEQPGYTRLLEDEIGFSYRDKSSEGKAYSYDAEKFFLLEPRWQQLERMGLATSGGSATWTEKPVQYQGENLYPWPGRVNWVENETLLAYEEFLLFDTTKAKTRQAAQATYEEPKFKAWEKQVCDGKYKL